MKAIRLISVILENKVMSTKCVYELFIKHLPILAPVFLNFVLV